MAAELTGLCIYIRLQNGGTADWVMYILTTPDWWH